MKTLPLIALCLISFGVGIVFYGYYFDYLILNLPVHTAGKSSSSSPVKIEKRLVTLHFLNHDHTVKEETEILWPETISLAATYLLHNWLNFLDEENFTAKKISLQSALVSQSGNDLYISFDSNPFEQETAIYQKLLWIESLLKTLSSNGLEFTNVHFLVHHQELTDHHLDFSQGWPGSGFLNITDGQKNQ